MTRSTTAPRRSQTILAGLLTAASVIALAGCAVNGADAAASDPSKTIAISFPNYSKTPALQIEIDAAEEEAEKHGYTLVLDDPAADLDKQVSTIKTWIPQGYAAIVAVALDATVLEGVAKEATAAGVQWITYGSSLDNQTGEVDMNQQVGGAVLGQLAADWFNENMNGEGQVAILGYQQGEWARNRVEGIKDALAKSAPGVEIVTEQDALSETEGLDATKNLLQAYPNLNGILGVEDSAIVGAYEAIPDKTSDSMFLGGMDGTLPALQAIQEGGAYRGSAALDLPAIGRGIVTSAIAAATGDGESVYKVDYTPVTNGSSELDAMLKIWE